MKHLKYLFPLLLVTLFISSCSEDDGPIPPNEAPTSSIDVTALTIGALDSFTVNISATAASTNPLNTLAVQKDGVVLPPAGITLDDMSIGGNPKLLLGDDKNSFNYKVRVITDLVAGDVIDYEFVITAENGDRTTEIVTVSVDVPMDPPSVDLVGTEVTIGETLLQIPIKVEQGSADLSTIAVYENGALATPSRLTLGAMSVWSENPYTLPASLQSSFEETLLVSLPTTTDTFNYMIIVEDASSLKDTLAFDVPITVGTAIDSMKMDLMLENAGGPEGQGAINLITGESVGSDDAGAHLRDLGIDDSLPVATNWLQQIAAANATEELRIPASAVDFASIQYKEDIQDIYDAGTAITESDKLNGGEVFVLKTLSGAYVLVQIESVNVVTDSNEDSYTINAKF